ncbi:MAG: acetyl-CoA carboxylase biotin carboxyl carrier protein [Oscillospiraceae bacterium]|nr:acetyl-CoA carboxylase biotin carboxyl carrier protein [Oscillospiraceae bacterium]
MAIFESKDDIFELIDKFEKSALSELQISTGADFHIKLSKSGVNINNHKVWDSNDSQPDIIPDIYEEAPEVFENMNMNIGRGDSGAPSPEKDNKIIKSPLVGIFYSSPSPDTEPYVKIGDKISKGMVICIIEAMKIMNEIEGDADGEIAEILVSNGRPVEYGQPLFRLK